MQQRRPPEPKPFFWIPLRGTPERKQPVFHERFSGWTGWLTLDIEVFSDYLYVGSGQIDLVRINGREQARYTFTRRDGQLVIPATSIKGAVRSVFEAITNSCVRIVAKATRSRGKIIKPDERPWFQKGGQYESWAACSSTSNLCPACRVFGTTEYRGRVYFTDAEPVEAIRTATIKISDLWPPRRTQGRKFYETKKFQSQDLTPRRNTRFIEVVPKGSLFRTRLRFENMSESELGALLRAMGIIPKENDPDSVVLGFPVKLGGAKPRCLGSVYFRPRAVRIVTSPQQSWLEGLIQPEEEGEWRDHLSAWLQDTSLLDLEAWKTFREAAQPKTDRTCPREVY